MDKERPEPRNPLGEPDAMSEVHKARPRLADLEQRESATGSQDAAQLVEDASQVSEVANGEPTHDGVRGTRAQGQSGRVGLDEGSTS